MDVGSDDELRLMHWNVHSWCDDQGAANVDAVGELIRAWEPDVVSLVEVNETWGDRSVLDELAGRTGYVTIFVPAFEFGHDDSHGDGDSAAGGFGNALLTRLPILAVRQRQLLWPPRVFDGSEPSEPRSAVFARLQTVAGPLWAGGTHLPRGDGASRAGALRRLAGIVRDLTDPWLLLGDFNVPAAEWLTGCPSWRAYPSGEPTYPAAAPTEAIDYCVAPAGLVVSAQVAPDGGSDHLAILVRCRLAELGLGTMFGR